MGTFRHPVGPLPSTVYWRRRLVVLGIPLFVIALVAYAATGSSGTPGNDTGAIGSQGGPGPGASPTGVISAAPGETASGPPGARYPGSGPTGSSGAVGAVGGSGSAAGAGGTGGTPSAAAGTNGSGAAQAGLGGGSGCALSLSLAPDRAAGSGPARYPAGTYPTFKITAVDSGSANCTVDVSGRGLVVSVAPLGATTPVWTSSTCSGAADLRVLGPGDAQTFPVVWKRWEGQGDTCPASKLPTVASGAYTVSAQADGVTTGQVEFILD